MTRSILYLFVALLFTSTAFADEAGDRALAELSQRLKELGNYESDITLTVQDNSLKGHYRISGDDYHIDMESVEIWGQEGRRYEVSHKIEEVVVESMESSDNMLLNNPSRAFDFVGQGFDAIVDKGAEGVVLLLTPKAEGEATLDVDQISIYLDTKTLLPTKILYSADNDNITVEFKALKKSKSKLEKFDLSRYKKYEVVYLL